MTNLGHALRDAGLAACLLLGSCSSGNAEPAGAEDPQVGASSVGQTGAMIARAAMPIRGVSSDYDALIATSGAARFVLLGEATHGTSEFYRERARISMRLVREKGFRAIVIEGDWPDTGRVNNYVRGLGNDRSAQAALGDFTDFPRWMWRNAEFRDFVEALRAHNMSLPAGQRVGVYGMDVYNMFGAADAVVRYLETVDRPAAAQARAQYRCFDRYRPDMASYGSAARRAANSCKAQAEAVLAQIKARGRPADPVAAEAFFSALRSAASVAGAEEYFRIIYSGDNGWNARDRRMATTVTEVADHVAALSGAPGKVVVWAHNSHVGDARASDMSSRGELNLGQLMRERFGDAVFLLGFTTYDGTVIAADEWGGPHRLHVLNRARPDSYAGLFHAAGIGNALLMLPRGSEVARALDTPRAKREIGVIYARATEGPSHYTRARLSRQFDAVIHWDRTRGVSPLP
jgi:erythromycin esterase-like protein